MNGKDRPDREKYERISIPEKTWTRVPLFENIQVSINTVNNISGEAEVEIRIRNMGLVHQSTHIIHVHPMKSHFDEYFDMAMYIMKEAMRESLSKQLGTQIHTTKLLGDSILEDR